MATAFGAATLAGMGQRHMLRWENAAGSSRKKLQLSNQPHEASAAAAAAAATAAAGIGLGHSQRQRQLLL